MAAIFGSGDINVKYVTEPGLNGQREDGIIVFNTQHGVDGDTSKALLMNSVTIDFQRGLSRQYFLNTNGAAYLVGVGQGTLTVSGLLGEAEDFVSVFGTDDNDICDKLFTVEMDVSGMRQCGEARVKRDDGGVEPIYRGKIKLSGVIPVSVRITAQIQQDGVLFYNANATFQFTKMEMDA